MQRAAQKGDRIEVKFLMNSGKKHFATLDGLRGMAALLVLAHHATNPFKLNAIDIRAGLAVEFFFVLSGFVIAYAYEHKLVTKELSVWAFLRLRVIRLYPLAFIGFLCGALIFFAKVLGHHRPISTDAWIAAICGLLVLPTAVDVAPGWDSAWPYDGPSWSLFFEGVVNIGYVLIVRRLKTRTLVSLIVVSGAALVLQGRLVGSLRGGGEWRSLYQGIARVVFPFFLGVLIFRRLSAQQHPQFRFGPVLCVLALVTTLLFPANRFDLTFECAAVILIFPAIVYFGAAFDGQESAKPIFFSLGAISYPLYVLHYPFIHLFSHYIRMNKLNGTSLYLAIFAECSVALAFSLVAMKYFDKPIRSKLSLLWARKMPDMPKAFASKMDSQIYKS